MIAFLPLLLSVGDCAVLVQRRSLLAYILCGIPELYETIKYIAVIFIVGHAVKIEVDAKTCCAAYKLLQVLLRTQLRDRLHML